MKTESVPSKLEFARTMLRVHGCLSDAENEKVKRRIMKRAKALGHARVKATGAQRATASG